ncbi:hypothetical protein RD792_012722 [Penstemon davidsonii]|uniref:GrpE protein homolog n=1 Tax=Penstemon davidsonii TaxID=160366 RepID=A0ABR0CZ46_9LAMI|nr:hypothetical protein RD792_012722 [Penstemon davidsonii]
MEGGDIHEKLLRRQGIDKEEEEEEISLKNKIWSENKRMWVVAGPAIFTRFSTFGVTVISQAFVGHIGATELAAYALVITLLTRFANGLLVQRIIFESEMATTVLKNPTACFSTAVTAGGSSVTSLNFPRVSFISSKLPVIRCRIFNPNFNRNSAKLPSRSFEKFLSFAANGETAEAQTETEEIEPDTVPEIEGNTDGAIDDDSSSEGDDAVEPEPSSAVLASLSLYKEALTNGDEAKVAEVESFLKSLEDEKADLEKKVATLSEELSSEKVRILRISADFDNFRKRTERERLSLVTNAQGELVESLLPVMDNFERAKVQIKVETEGEEKITNSYQSIYKQFVEIMGSLGVVPVETVGKPFDPMLHEAIMREDSTEYEDGLIIEEYRKGFQLGERLLRPSMVKVSAGPGPAKPETGGPSDVQEEVTETGSDGSTEATTAATEE